MPGQNSSVGNFISWIIKQADKHITPTGEHFVAPDSKFLTDEQTTAFDSICDALLKEPDEEVTILKILRSTNNLGMIVNYSGSPIEYRGDSYPTLLHLASAMLYGNITKAMVEAGGDLSAIFCLILASFAGF